MSQEIRLLAEECNDGQTIRVICPRCGGGSKKESTLTITRDGDGIVYNCYRASCDNVGAFGGSRVHTTTPQTPQPRRKIFSGEVRELPEGYSMWIRRTWGIDDPVHWYYTPEYGGRIAMSIRSPKYTHRGWVLRDVSGQAKVKALSFIDEGEEGISWYRNHPGAPVVVVEDIPSAIRASRYMNSVALLGTGISAARAVEISTYSPSVIMALDQDATSLSFKWARKYSLLWGDVSVLPIHKDFKDMTEEEIQRYLA